MYKAKAYSACSSTPLLAATPIRRRDPGERDVQLNILFCGICHSDLYRVRNEWKEALPTVYPCVPGHEIVGRFTKVGRAVTKFKLGDLSAVGCLVDPDHTFLECKAGLEQFCPNPTLTYNFPDNVSGGITYGGYSDSIVVAEHFVLDAVRTRTVERRSRPFPPLTEATKHQEEKVFTNVRGTLAGFRTPTYANGFGVAGFHLHFLRQDRQAGGHALDYRLRAGRVQVCTVHDLRVRLPTSAEFLNNDIR